MAVATLQWSPHSGTPGDGSTGNAGPALLVMAGSESNPKKQLEIAAFDAATDEHLWFPFRMPDNYASAPKVILGWMASATANKCAWGARLAAITPGDADTPVEHAEAAAAVVSAEVNVTEARRLIETTIEPNADSVAAGDFVELLVYRDADGTAATDSLTVDAELLIVTLQYTTT
jgi:hypothetical protein